MPTPRYDLDDVDLAVFQIPRLDGLLAQLLLSGEAAAAAEHPEEHVRRAKRLFDTAVRYLKGPWFNGTLVRQQRRGCVPEMKKDRVKVLSRRPLDLLAYHPTPRDLLTASSARPYPRSSPGLRCSR